MTLTEQFLLKNGFSKRGGKEGFFFKLGNFEVGQVSKGFFFQYGVDNNYSLFIETEQKLSTLYLIITGASLPRQQFNPTGQL